MKLPYKLEFRNCYELLKECFGIEEHKREKRDVVQLEEIIIHTEPKREKERRKIYSERLDIPVNKYLMVDASTNTDYVENEVLSSLPKDAHDYVFLE